MTILRKYILLLTISLLLPAYLKAQQENTKIFRDTLDGAFDASYWLFDLHGFIPVLRYQGDLTILAETEQCINVYKRWSLVGFGGIGTTVPSLNEMSFGDTAWNAGAGFRYLLARVLGLQMGMDFARGPEDWAFYIVFGSSWLK